MCVCVCVCVCVRVCVCVCLGVVVAAEMSMSHFEVDAELFDTASLSHLFEQLYLAVVRAGM